jgi:hypothetical protein
MKVIDRQYLTNAATTLGDIAQSKRVDKAVPVARAARDFISQNFAGIKKMNDLVIVVANVENATSGD